MRIGVYLSAGKLKKPEFLALQAQVARTPNVELEVINLSNPTGNYDIILHKLTDDLVHEKWDEQMAKNIAGYEDWCRNTRMIDSISPQRVVIDRIGLINFLRHTLMQISNVYIPQQQPISQSMILARNAIGLNYPLICKTIQACGSISSHSMAIVHDETAVYSALERISNEYLEESGRKHNIEDSIVMVQEFVPHGAVVNKVYVLGHHVWVQQRGSLPDNPTNGHFHSHKMGNLMQNGGDVVSQGTAEAIAVAIGQALNINIFGFDVLMDSRDGRAAVIDINYFPGFKGVESFPEHLVNFLIEYIR